MELAPLEDDDGFFSLPTFFGLLLLAPAPVDVVPADKVAVPGGTIFFSTAVLVDLPSLSLDIFAVTFRHSGRSNLLLC